MRASDLRIPCVWFCLAALLAFASCGTDAPVARPFSALVVFGDSLSDNGNLTGALNIVPPPPYAPGRISNGDIWVDHVARHFDLPADPAYIGGTNFALGAAGTGRGLATIGDTAVAFNLREQVSWYLDLYDPHGDELFIVWSGGNDLFDILSGTLDISPADAAANVAIAITVLYDAGARRFLVINAPDLSLTPRYLNSGRKQRAHDLTVEFNTALSMRLDQLDSFDRITIARIDAETALRDLSENPPPGITNTTDPAWTGDLFGYLGDGEIVANPDEYLYWDRVHPTRAGHGRIAAFIIAAIEQSIANDPPSPTTTREQRTRFDGSFSFWFRYLGI